MKRCPAVFVVAMLSAFAADAADTSKNPDRYASVGFNYTGDAMDGKMPVTNTRLNRYDGVFIGDIRLPLYNALTLDVGIGHIRSNSSAATLSNTEMEGVIYSAGLRFYFNADATQR